MSGGGPAPREGDSAVTFRLDPGKPPLKVKRFLIRLGMLIAVVWGSPLVLLGMISLFERGYGAIAIAVFITFAALCHVMGRLVGRFERDTPVQYGVGCSWPYWLIGALTIGSGSWPPLLMLPMAVVGFIAGFTGARKSVGRRSRLIREGKCVFCEYDLSGLESSGVCPECGQKFQREGAPQG